MATAAAVAAVRRLEDLEALGPDSDVAELNFRAEGDDVADLQGQFLLLEVLDRVVGEVGDVEGAQLRDVGETLEEGVLFLLASGRN